MDSPVQPLPLTLLMGGTAAETGAGLATVLRDNPEFLLSHAGANNISTFDIVYRAVSFQITVNEPLADLSGFKKIFCNLDPAAVGSSIDIGLGEHVSGGERVPTIVQGLLDIGQRLGLLLDPVAVIWHPAKLVSGFDYFSETVSDYLAGGAFPVLALVNFKAEPDGLINSCGLNILSGQELQIVAAGFDQADLMRRVVRVVHDVAVNGPILQAVKLGGIELGEILELEPSPDATLLKMNILSDFDR